MTSEPEDEVLPTSPPRWARDVLVGWLQDDHLSLDVFTLRIKKLCVALARDELIRERGIFMRMASGMHDARLQTLEEERLQSERRAEALHVVLPPPPNSPGGLFAPAPR
jgi:hypothetical protein